MVATHAARRRPRTSRVSLPAGESSTTRNADAHLYYLAGTRAANFERHIQTCSICSGAGDGDSGDDGCTEGLRLAQLADDGQDAARAAQEREIWRAAARARTR